MSIEQRWESVLPPFFLGVAPVPKKETTSPSAPIQTNSLSLEQIINEAHNLLESAVFELSVKAARDKYAQHLEEVEIGKWGCQDAKAKVAELCADNNWCNHTRELLAAELTCLIREFAKEAKRNREKMLSVRNSENNY